MSARRQSTGKRADYRRAPNPGFSRASPSRDASAAQRAVYCASGSDRIGSIEQRGTEFIARDRQGRLLGGTFNNENDALAAICRAAGGAP